jgi:hypothetical protein
VVLAAAGCGASTNDLQGAAPSATPPPPASPSPTPNTLAAPLTATHSALVAMTHANSSYEPRGDVSLADWRQGVVFYARVFRINVARRTITFDVEQFYRGTAAAREAALTGALDEDQTYIRNQFTHVETARLAEGVVPILAIWGGSAQSLRAIVDARGRPVEASGFWLAGGINGTPPGVIDMLVMPDVP